MSNSSPKLTALKQKHVDIIREAAIKAEKDGKISRPLIALMQEQQWCKMLVPAAYGGTQMPLHEILQLEEAIAYIDGSTGWLLALLACSGWYGGFLEAEVAQKVFSDPKMCIAHSSDNGGVAEKTKSGYKISGTWRFVAGAQDATAFIANCTVKEKGKDQQQVMPFLFLKSEVTVLPTWNAMGLVGTGSHSFEIKDLAVTADRMLKTSGAAKSQHLYQFPFSQLVESSLAASVSGMTMHFIELCKIQLSEKKKKDGTALADDNTVSDILDKYPQKFDDARAKLQYAVDMAWQVVLNFQTLKPATLYKISASASDLVKKAIECADAIYPFCGIEAVDRSSEINRVWRDLHTAGQHPLLVFGGME